MIGPQSTPDIHPEPGRIAIPNAVRSINELPFEPFWSLQSSQHCTAIGIIIATLTVLDGVSRLNDTPISTHAKTSDIYEGLNNRMIAKATRLPSPVFWSAKPKKSAGTSVQIDDCVKPENTTAGFSPRASAKKAKNSPPAEYDKLKGLKIQIDSAISMPPSISCAVSLRLTEKGFANMMMTAISTISPLPIYDAFIFCAIFITSEYYFFDEQSEAV